MKHFTPSGTDLCGINSIAHNIAESAIVAYWLETRDESGLQFHRKQLSEKAHALAAALGCKLVPEPRSIRHPDYSETLLIGSSSLQVGINYRYDAGYPMRGPSLTCPGEPGEPASAEITGIYWRGDAPTEAWREADDAIAELLIEAMGGDDAVQAALISDAEGAAEAAACDRGDYLLDRAREDAA